jgi:hypothetical protein
VRFTSGLWPEVIGEDVLVLDANRAVVHHLDGAAAEAARAVIAGHSPKSLPDDVRFALRTLVDNGLVTTDAQLTRRGLLRTGGAIAGAIGVSTLALPPAAASHSGDDTHGSGEILKATAVPGDGFFVVTAESTGETQTFKAAHKTSTQLDTEYTVVATQFAGATGLGVTGLTNVTRDVRVESASDPAKQSAAARIVCTASFVSTSGSVSSEQTFSYTGVLADAVTGNFARVDGPTPYLDIDLLIANKDYNKVNWTCDLPGGASVSGTINANKERYNRIYAPTNRRVVVSWLKGANARGSFTFPAVVG